MVGADFCATEHLNATCTSCVGPRRRAGGNMHVMGGYASTTVLFGSWDGCITKFLPRIGATIAPRVKEILSRLLRNPQDNRGN